MNPSALLALISTLYEQIVQQQAELDQLRAQLAAADKPRST